MSITQTSPLAARPAHVPPDLVYDLDIFHLAGAQDDVHEAWKRVQIEAPRIFWTPRNGGYWMITRAADIIEVQQDHAHFSLKKMLIPDNPRPYPAPPIDFDPPFHAPWRMLISPAFSPKMVAAIEQTARQVTVELIEGFAPRGECEFVAEFTKVLPIVVFLSMMDLPPEDRQQLMAPADAIARSSEIVQINAARLQLMAYIQRAVDMRRTNPGDDLISRVLAAKIDGQPIDNAHVVGMCTLMLSGGLDTVKNLLGFCAKFLATHPDHLRRLREKPEIIPHAVDELTRRHGVSNTARLIVEDYAFLGVQLKAGEQIQGITALVGLDDETVADPMNVDFTRPAPIPHAAFGNGPHRCPAAILAKREIVVWLQEWLPRIGAFHIKPGTVPQQGSAMVNSVSELWLAWDPAR